jgi:FPC/CPF motif-containing protein YcgG
MYCSSSVRRNKPPQVAFVLRIPGEIEIVSPTKPDAVASATPSACVYDPDDGGHPLAARFRVFVGEYSFPCVGAKSALGRGQMHFLVARSIESAWDDLRIYNGLLRFASRYRENPKLFVSFVVLFQDATAVSEHQFEHSLWQRVQSLSDKDGWHGQAYDDRVSADPESRNFSLSFGGEAFFVVGLHPGASRLARKFETPALVFNLHDQFEELRRQDRYEGLRKSIISRDVALAGLPNPMLARHGDVSEARQYSGRAVERNWSCPFDFKPGSTTDAP